MDGDHSDVQSSAGTDSQTEDHEDPLASDASLTRSMEMEELREKLFGQF